MQTNQSHHTKFLPFQGHFSIFNVLLDVRTNVEHETVWARELLYRWPVLLSLRPAKGQQNSAQVTIYKYYHHLPKLTSRGIYPYYDHSPPHPITTDITVWHSDIHPSESSPSLFTWLGCDVETNQVLQAIRRGCKEPLQMYLKRGNQHFTLTLLNIYILYSGRLQCTQPHLLTEICKENCSTLTLLHLSQHFWKE